MKQRNDGQVEPHGFHTANTYRLHEYRQNGANVTFQNSSGCLALNTTHYGEVAGWPGVRGPDVGN